MLCFIIYVYIYIIKKLKIIYWVRNHISLFSPVGTIDFITVPVGIVDNKLTN
jgi:hypothetical protein